MEHWIAVYTKSRHEKVVYDQLTTKNIEAYLPTIRQKRKWSDRYKWVDVPLFRSYVFAKIPLKNSLFVLQTHGVHHIVKFKNNIATIPEEQINGIRRMIEGDYDPIPTDYFVLGDAVEVVGGPMSGMSGEVTRIDGEDRFVIKIDAIKHAISVHIDRKFLKPLGSSKHARPAV
ncbi:MAG: UpxY family transcription antiterminator [FCB group bacterium]|nr:UpxY family transcription antiterminator [FCB group bacterium]